MPHRGVKKINETNQCIGDWWNENTLGTHCPNPRTFSVFQKLLYQPTLCGKFFYRVNVCFFAVLMYIFVCNRIQAMILIDESKTWIKINTVTKVSTDCPGAR